MLIILLNKAKWAEEARRRDLSRGEQALWRANCPEREAGKGKRTFGTRLF
jgi:hypothetical protein